MKYQKTANPSRWFSCLTCRATLILLATCAFFGLTDLASAQNYLMTNLWYAGIGTANLVNDNNNRGLAYDAVSNLVYIAGRTTSTLAISVLDATSGTVIANNFPNISITPYNVGVADDGVIYGVPLANGVSSANLNIYSWTNWQSLQRQCYVQSGSDATSLAAVQGQRVGDSFAIYGGGINTLIVLPINTGTSTHSTNNMLLFSTTDGQTFTPTLISISGLPTPSVDNGPQHGVAFIDSTHILFRPGVGTSTYLIQFPANFASLSSPVAASVIATNTTLPNGAGSDVYLFSYSPAGKLLADYGQILSSAGSTTLGLYDISSFPTANSVGTTTTTHTNANGNFTGGVALGGPGKTNAIYVLDSNNGVWGFSLTFVPAAQAPVISAQPVGGSVYTNLGSFTFSITAAGTAPLIYYWQYNTVSNPATATTVFVATNINTYTISPLTTTASGWYDCIVSNTAGTTNSAVVQLTVSVPLGSSAYVTNLWSLAADNSEPYLDTSYNTRGLAFDPKTMSVLLAEHSAAQIYALNATNGQFKFMITTPETGLPEGSIFPLGQVVVADDGVVYCCNVSSYNPSSDTAIPGETDFSITRFDGVVSATNADGSLNPTNTFEAAFTGDPGNYLVPGSGTYSGGDRWGDSMAVRGAGPNTQILLGTYESFYDSGGNLEYGTGPGTNVAILTTTDGINFTPTTIVVSNVPDGFSYLGVAWGQGNTFWTKSPGYDLRQIQYDLTTGTGIVIQDYSTTASAGSLDLLCGIGLDVSNNILAGVNVGDTPNDLELFQIPTLGFPPESYYQAFFPTNNPNINGNAATTVKFPYIFSLDANNGIIALQYSLPLLPFGIVSTYTNNQQIFTWQTIIGHTYQVQTADSLAGAWSNVGPSIPVSSSGTLSYTNSSLSGSAKFYRIVAQ
ncbi:MAG: immunoglobulin domain-containing protein [Verrucomicrobiia bacterium]